MQLGSFLGLVSCFPFFTGMCSPNFDQGGVITIVSLHCFLLIVDLPALRVTPAEVYINAGETASFTCYGSGHPAPHVTWDTSR